MDASHPEHVVGNKYENVIKEFYKKIDQAIGELIMELPADTNIIITSDHGFGACHGFFSLNNWLEQNGYLKFKHSLYRVNVNEKLRSVRDFLLARLNPQLVRGIARILPPGISDRINTSGEARDGVLNLYHNVDWSQSRAYAMGTASGGIYIVGQNKEGVRDEIIEKLNSLGFHAFKKEEVFCGQYTEEAPDISIELGSSRYYPRAFGESVWASGAISGHHIAQGLFMACGTEIASKGKISDLSIYDVTPTILHSFGLPVPEDIDGRVLSEIFRDGSSAANTPVKLKSRKRGSRQEVKTLTEKQEQKFKERLGNLGY